MDIDESQFESLVKQYQDREKQIIEYSKNEINAFSKETERSSALISNQLCLPRAQLSKCLIVRNSLISMHHEVAHPEAKEEDVDYFSTQVHWTTGEATVSDNHDVTEQCILHLGGSVFFKSRTDMLKVLNDMYLKSYQSDDDYDEQFGFFDEENEKRKLDDYFDQNQQPQQQQQKNETNQNKSSVLGKRTFKSIQRREKERSLQPKIIYSDSESESDYESESESDSSYESVGDIEFKYEPLELAKVMTDLLNDLSRWCLYGYTPMKKEELDDELPVTCSRIEVDLIQEKLLLAWSFSYDLNSGTALLGKAQSLSNVLKTKITSRILIDKLSQDDLEPSLIKRLKPEYEMEKDFDQALTQLLAYKPYYDLTLREAFKLQQVPSKKLKLLEKKDVLGRPFSCIYDPEEDKVYFYDPTHKCLTKDWVMELDFKQCHKIVNRMIEMWVLEDCKIDELKNGQFSEEFLEMNKKLKIK